MFFITLTIDQALYRFNEISFHLVGRGVGGVQAFSVFTLVDRMGSAPLDHCPISESFRIIPEFRILRLTFYRKSP